jgi:signal transduction histidine kinase
LCHHFNNILQAILGNTELAANQLPKDHPTQSAIRHVLSETRRAASLSRVLLVTIGHGIHRLQYLVLDDFLRDSQKVFDAVLQPGQQLQYVSGAGDAMIRADPESLRELVMNLVRNASEALKSDPTGISIQTGRMVCDRAYLSEPHLDANLPEGPYVYMDVIDQGEGMSQEQLKKIFDPFFSTKYQGRGLGMSVVLGILRGHGGAVKIQSQPGKGTTVRVLFPESHLPVQSIPG